MFEVKVGITIRLEGCPESGIPAIDFRRQHQLPEAPDNKVRLEWKGVSESLCRAFPELVDDQTAMEVVTGSTGYSRYELVSYTPKNALASDRARRTLEASRVPVAIAHAFLVPAGAQATEDAVHQLLTCLKDQAAAARAKYAEEDAVAEQVRAAERAANVEQEERRKAKQAAGAARLREWAAVHGSELTQLRMQEGLDSWIPAARADYVTAALAEVVTRYTSADVPEGFKYEDCDVRKSPTVPELRALRQLRTELADKPCGVGLIWARYIADDEDASTGEREKMARAELQVTVTCPDGHAEDHEFLVPETSPAEATQ